MLLFGYTFFETHCITAPSAGTNNKLNTQFMFNQMETCHGGNKSVPKQTSRRFNGAKTNTGPSPSDTTVTKHVTFMSSHCSVTLGLSED